jgi:hypothetical protein
MSFTSDESKKSGDIVDLAAFRAKKDVQEQLARGRDPLFVSHLDGKIKGSPHLSRPKAEDFGDRIQRIRTSLEKINRLMTELKKISKDDRRSST